MVWKKRLLKWGAWTAVVVGVLMLALYQAARDQAERQLPETPTQFEPRAPH
jgi:hypothetical protein